MSNETSMSDEICMSDETVMLATSGAMAMLHHEFDHDSEELNRFAGEEYNKIRIVEPLIAADIIDAAKASGANLEDLKNSVRTAFELDQRLYEYAYRKGGLSADLNDDLKADLKDHIRYLLSMPDNIKYVETCSSDKIDAVTHMTIEYLEKVKFVLTGIKKRKNCNYLTLIAPYGCEIKIIIQSDSDSESVKDTQELSDLPSACEFGPDLPGPEPEVKMPEIEAPLIVEFEMPLKQKMGIINHFKSLINIVYETAKTETRCKVIYFAVSFKDAKDTKPILEGYESDFSDRSAWQYRIYRKFCNGTLTESAMRCSISLEGKYVWTREEDVVSCSLAEAIRLTDKQVRDHDKWLRETFSEEMMDILDY